MKIYKVYKGWNEPLDIHSLEVRETKKMYISEKRGGPAFRHVKMFDKSISCVSPAEAIQERRNMLLTKKGGLEDKLAQCLSDIEELDQLERETA